MAHDLIINDRITIPRRDLTWSAVRASGPGGQNVNKVASKVELWFDLEATEALGVAVKQRLRAAAGRRVAADGRLLITVQDTRDQGQNLELARGRLAAMIRAALVPPKRRRATRPTRASRERRLTDKRVQSTKKQGRAHRARED